MKITDRSTNATKTFGELKPGDVFRDSDGDIVMKTSPFYIGEKTNCVILKNGEGYIYDDDDQVIPITDVELVIG